MHTHTHVNIRISLARTGVLPGEACFDSARPAVYAFWDVIGLPNWLTRFVSKTQNPEPQILNSKT